MSKLRAIIVDDERLARRALRALLAAHAEAVEVVGEAATVVEAEAQIARAQPDLLFLDVQLRGETGFDLLPRLEPLPRIVFVTAFDVFAVRAFEVNALDYLLKPIEPERLAEALRRAQEREKPAPALPVQQPGFSLDDLFFYEDGQRSRFIRIRDIAFIHSAGNYTELHLPLGKKVLVLKTLAAWEAELPEAAFVRVHRTSIVNLGFVEQVERLPGYSYALHLRGHAEPLMMSRRRALALKRRLQGEDFQAGR